MRIPSGTTDQYICATCEVLKPLSDFGKDKKQSRGYKYSCKECTNKKRRGKYQEENRVRYLKTKYGITEEYYMQLYAFQKGCCAICGQVGEKRSGGNRAKDSTELYVDHDHVSREIRGLLCHKCNVAIGLLNDDPVRIKMAEQYIRGLTPCVLKVV